MNLLLLAHRVPYPADKGEKIRTFNNLAYLVKQGHTVTVFTPLENSHDLRYANQLSEKLNVTVAHSKLTRRTARVLKGLSSGQALSVTNFYSAELQQQLCAVLLAEKPDSILCTSSAMAKYVFHREAAAIIKRQKIRLVMDFIDLDSYKWRQYAERSVWPLSLVYKREEKLLSKLESKILDRFDASLFVTKEETELLNKYNKTPSNVCVVGNGVDRASYYPAKNSQPAPEQRLLSKDSPILLFTGVMDYFPNEDAVSWFANTVWPEVYAAHPDAKFKIVGMRPGRKVRQLAQHKGIEVTGYVENILPYYQQADFLIAPFRVARGIQNKIIQAMSCGLPVISSPEGAAGINYINNKHLVVVEQASKYLAAIDDLLTNKESYQCMSRSGIELVTSQYSWEAANNRLSKILMGDLTYT